MNNDTLLLEWKELNTDRYYQYISSIIDNRGQWGIENDEYYEGHHIILKSFGGNGNTRQKDKNIIRLYAREHFEAHKILAEDNPCNFKIVSAWMMMAFPKSDKTDREFEVSPEEYEKLRKTFGEARKKHPVSEETKIKLSKVKTGIKLGPCSDEHKSKLSDSNKHPHNISVEGLEVLQNNSKKYLESLSDEEYIAHCKKCGEHVKNKKWFTNGSQDVRAIECPDGFVPGRSCLSNKKHSQGRHFYNNGIITVCVFEQPEGFIPGRLPYQTSLTRDEFGKFIKQNKGEI